MKVLSQKKKTIKNNKQQQKKEAKMKIRIPKW